MALPLGAMRARLVLEAPSETPDGAGGVTRTFVARSALWARIEPLSAQERLVADSAGQVLTHRITLRWRAGLDAAMRWRSGARLFAIRTVMDPDERRRTLVCLCEEIRP